MKQTGFFWDEKCFWHGGGNFAFNMPLGGFVQPMAGGGGLPENPETKRRLKNLMDVTGLLDAVAAQSAPMATLEDLMRVHPDTYLSEFKALSDNNGGDLGMRTPFTKDGFEVASLSAGLAKAALSDVLSGKLKNAYSLSRPPGHHCLPDYPMGFCLLANIAIAIEAAISQGQATRFAVLDWDVHHGNGTEAIFYDRDDVLTISIHQERNFPLDTGDHTDRGRGAGNGYNMNIPLPGGCGDAGYLDVIDRLVTPALRKFQPDVIIVASGFDATPFDPLAQMMVSAAGFAAMTERMMTAAAELCSDRLVLVHEGGYSEAYVPFCGHAVISTLASSDIHAEDPLRPNIEHRQPNERASAFYRSYVDDFVKFFGFE